VGDAVAEWHWIYAQKAYAQIVIFVQKGEISKVILLLG
jgi:hypothetical protein